MNAIQLTVAPLKGTMLYDNVSILLLRTLSGTKIQDFLLVWNGPLPPGYKARSLFTISYPPRACS